MSDEKLNEITTVLRRIEGKIDTGAARFEQHAASDEVAFRALARNQRGYIAGAVSVLIAIGAGIAYMARRVIGH